MRSRGVLQTPLTPTTRVLVIGKTCADDRVVASLRPSGVSAVLSPSGREALERVSDIAPALVVVGRPGTKDLSSSEVVRRLRALPGRRPRVVVIGELDPASTATDQDYLDEVEDYLPADVGLPELLNYIRGRLKLRPLSVGPLYRRAISEARLDEEIERELRRAALANRQGMLAVVHVAEMVQLRKRFGSKANQAVSAAFDEVVARDAHILEQHSLRSDGGFFLLMPETDAVAGRDRLQRLSRHLAVVSIDVGGEHVRVTPVIGYASFRSASSAHDLRDQAATAARDARRHLDLVPVLFTDALAAGSDFVGKRDIFLAFVERLRSPAQIVFTMSLLVLLPYLIYVIAWYSGFDLTTVTYPLVAAALTATAAALWIESFRAVGSVELPPEQPGDYPTATSIIAAYLPNEAATILDTVTNHLQQDYVGELQVILAYNTPQRLPVEETLAQLAAQDSRLLLLRVPGSTSKAQNINAALAYVRGEFVGVFDADHHPEPGSFTRAWRWLSSGHDIVQGHCVVRNGDVSWVARMVAVEFESIYAVSHPGRARLHGFGIFGGSNGYWTTDALRQIRMQGTMLTEDIDSSMRSLLDGFSIVSDPELVSTELAPTTMTALWNQRMRWAQGWTQTSRRHLRPALRSRRLSGQQKIGAGFLLGWTQVVPWVTFQVIPILAFVAWRDGGIGRLDWFVPLFVLLSIFTFSVGPAQAIFAYALGDQRVRRHRWWFMVYAFHSMIWYGELKNLISRVAQLKELSGERQWRVTPRAPQATMVIIVPEAAESSQASRAM